MNRKTVLIITYYWPPCGGSGVQRWLKFVKYMRENGWEPVIYTPENPECPSVDQTLLADIPEGITVIKRPILEPYSLYKKFTGRKESEKIGTGFMTESGAPGLAEKISVWIRGNLFIPDARRFWIRPSIRFLKSWLAEHKVDAIVSTGPPHSMHMIGLGVHRATGLPWIADFRDPWTEIDFYDELMLTRLADSKHRQMEKSVIKMASKVVVVTPHLKKIYEERYQRSVNLVTNGFDPEDFDTEPVAADKKFSIAHIGSMVRSRNPEALWTVLAHICEENEEFRLSLKIDLVGKTDINVLNSIGGAGLYKYMEKIDYMPHHEVTRYEKKASVLLLVLNQVSSVRTFIPAKLYEYLAARRPILCIGPTDTDAAGIIRECSAGETADYSDEARMKSIILDYFHKYQQGKLSVAAHDVDRFSRKNLTREITAILDEITG